MLTQVLAFLLASSAAQVGASQPATSPAAPPAATTAPASRPASQPSVFDLPRLQGQYAMLHAQVADLFAQKRYDQAERLLRQAIAIVPHDVTSHYNLACSLARQGKADEALAALAKAVALGYNQGEAMRADDDLASLRERAEFKDLLERSRTAKVDPDTVWQYSRRPGPVKDGVAMVTEDNTAWDGRLGLFRVAFAFGPGNDKPIASGLGPAGDLLRAWQKDGTACGNHGDLYDNHDSDHSNMSTGSLPQLARIEFDEPIKQRRLHHGLQMAFLYSGPTLGNSSTALTAGPFWRSQPRHALTSPRGPATLYVQYGTNHLYVYPEHRDHDEGRDGADGKGHGDLLPANTPYMVISQGSSGSDVAFLNALAATMAAFRPEVKQRLVKTGLLMPTLQMIFRMSNKMVQTPGDYLTGKAHPSVFDGGQIDLVKMVTLAHEMKPNELPPVVQIQVTEEDPALCGVDYFDLPERGEKLFDTPCAVARVVRSVRQTRRMVVSAAGSKDVMGRALTYHWAVLRGDASRIRINKVKPDGSVVELLIPYHERMPVLPGSKVESNRVDIGVFVHNGPHYSAPAFVSLLYLDNQKRTYDDQGRPAAVDYADPVVSRHYVDPVLDLPKTWRDEYRYGPDGRCAGWTRLRGKDAQTFTADGKRVIKADEKGMPLETRAVRYVLKPRQGQLPVLEQELVP